MQLAKYAGRSNQDDQALSINPSLCSCARLQGTAHYRVILLIGLQRDSQPVPPPPHSSREPPILSSPLSVRNVSMPASHLQVTADRALALSCEEEPERLGNIVLSSSNSNWKGEKSLWPGGNSLTWRTYLKLCFFPPAKARQSAFSFSRHMNFTAVSQAAPILFPLHLSHMHACVYGNYINQQKRWLVNLLIGM